MKRFFACASLVAIGLAACATIPSAPPVSAPPQAPPTPVTMQLRPASFAALPGWTQADHGPGLRAFQATCALMERRPADALVGPGGQYGGAVADWRPACAAAYFADPAEARAFFEAFFEPFAVEGEGGQQRLTGYFEPVIEARRSPEPGFDEPIRAVPPDLARVDQAAFTGDQNAAGRSVTVQVVDGAMRPYPTRAEIAAAAGPVIAYAHPADVYNLQVQGSGRLAFPEGTQVRAAFGAQNGHPWRSALGALRETGALETASWRAFRTWLDGADPNARAAALAADPSYVFFREEPIGDPAQGTRGAANTPLTPLGSIAIDPAFHPYGAVLFVDAAYDGGRLARTLVAQDTGGAIRRGPLRGDVYFGIGPQAGASAERMNTTDVAFWTLLPRAAPDPLEMSPPPAATLAKPNPEAGP